MVRVFLAVRNDGPPTIRPNTQIKRTAVRAVRSMKNTCKTSSAEDLRSPPFVEAVTKPNQGFDFTFLAQEKNHQCGFSWAIDFDTTHNMRL